MTADIMIEQRENKASAVRRPFIEFVAWLSFIIPLVTPFVWIGVLANTNGHLVTASTVATCLLAISLILGVTSLWTLCKHNGRKRFIILAVFGIAMSIVLGFFSLVFRSTPIC